MIIKKGIGICDGIAIGKICLDAYEEAVTTEICQTDVEAEVLRYEAAKKTALQQLRELADFRREAKTTINKTVDKTISGAAKEARDIFEAQAILLEDESYNQFVCNEIRANLVNAELAVTRAGDYFGKMFDQLGDAYLKERALDIKDITERVKSLLHKEREYKGREIEREAGKIEESQRKAEIEASVYTNAKVSANEKTNVGKTATVKADLEKSITNLQSKNKSDTEFSMIYISKELTPGRFMELHQRDMIAFAVQEGSTQSHTAILARSFGCPALCGIQIDSSWNGKIVILDVDGKEGKLLLEPDAKTLEECRKKQSREREQKTQFQEWKGRESVTKSGRKIELLANVNSMAELPAVLENDAEGIGLFRSECLFLEADGFPTEEEQFQVYKTMLEAMQNKRTVIRTLDLGADKQKNLRYLKTNEESLNLKQASLNTENMLLEEQTPEKNPALGCRGIRFSLKNPEIFRTQLRALFRASVFGNLAILYPMIASLSEIQKIKEISNAVRTELRAEGVQIGRVEEGIMIETPAAALMSDSLAKEVDFFSIGTNDLTQYTLAIDRQNEGLAQFYDAHHPAVLKLIQMTAEHAHRAGIQVEICGELAADLSLMETFLSFGMDALSVVPQNILPLRRYICKLDE